MQRSNPLVAQRYKTKRWQKLRHDYMISVNGLCERCKVKGIVKPALICHHKEYINESNYMNDNIFYNVDNLEAVCLECHNKEHFGNGIEYEFDENGDLII
jgi:5-methylcytosine-specific restriction endonuclease McrA